MTVRKILLAACAAALTTSPAWAHPGNGPSNEGGQPPAADHPTGNTGHGNSGGQHGKSHRCVAHRVGYVAAGTLAGQTLVLDTPASTGKSTRPTYSGDVTIAVTRTNHWARGDTGTTKTYTLARARVVFGLRDQNGDGSVGLDDLAAGDRVRVVGKVTVLHRGCDQSGFTPTIAIRQLIVHAPAAPAPSQPTS